MHFYQWTLQTSEANATREDPKKPMEGNESICVSAHSPGCWSSNFNKTKQKLSENNSLRLMLAPELPALALQTVTIPSAVATFSFSQEGILYYFFFPSFLSISIFPDFI